MVRPGAGLTFPRSLDRDPGPLTVSVDAYSSVVRPYCGLAGASTIGAGVDPGIRPSMARQEYPEAVTAVVILALGTLVGFVIGRWWSLALGLGAGLGALAAGYLLTAWAGDTPSISIGVLSMAAIAAGVLARARIHPRNTHPG